MTYVGYISGGGVIRGIRPGAAWFEWLRQGWVMSKLLLAALAALSIPLSVAAQPIQGSPQKAAFASPAEWVPVDGQCHWKALGVNTTGRPAHTHVLLKFPVNAIITTRDTFAVPFTLMLFETAGRITQLSGVRVKSWTLNDGATLPLIGNPSGLVSVSGTLIVDPTTAPLRGWYRVEVIVSTIFDNGDSVNTLSRLALYSMVDPTAPDGGAPFIDNTTCKVLDATQPKAGRWGQQFTEFKKLLPILGTISPESPWNTQVFNYNYAHIGPLAAGVSELWLDPDLHNGNPGTLLYTKTGIVAPSSLSPTYSLPTGIPEGTHKLLFAWRRATPEGDKELSSIRTYTVTVGPGGIAPPPPPPPPPPPNPCVADPLGVPTTGWVWPSGVTGVSITQIGRTCPAVEVTR